MIALWVHAAYAGDDLSVTSVGADAVRSASIDDQSIDLLLGQRLRWGLTDDVRALVDGRFAIDPFATTTFEESRLRELGVEYDSERLTMLIGRHPVQFGGPRLVDGIQALGHAGIDNQWSFGGWAGLVPDEFTTAPTLRFGAGPIVAVSTAKASGSLAGDLVVGEGGLNRAGALAMGRGELGRRFQATSRVDWVFTDGAGHGGLADGALFLQVRPVDAFRLDLVYDGYSSLLYQSRAGLDPTVQRFAARIEELGLTEGITQDAVDPTLHHLLGATTGLHGQGEIRPQLTLRARTQLHEDPTERYTRLGASTGIGGLAGDRLELDVDGNALWIEGRVATDAGLMVLVEPEPEGPAAIDGSFRILLDPVAYGPGAFGLYADLFVDVATRGGTSVSAGGSWSTDPDDVVAQDVGFGGFLRIQQWVRPGRGARPVPPAIGAADEPSDTTVRPTDSTATATGATAGS
ncbi:MAG: hypothetical protein ABMB14_06490 [Myxococcota bacterium]